MLEIIAKPEEYRYLIEDFSLYDGDTFYCQCSMTATVKVDIGFERYVTLHVKEDERFTVRLYGYDTPEIRERRPDFKAAGKLAKEKVVEWVKMAQVRGDCYFLSQGYEEGKYGRPMGDLVDCDDNRVSEFLVKERLAVHYHGQNKADIQEQHRVNVEYLKSCGKI